jgi:hypothetical protein
MDVRMSERIVLAEIPPKVNDYESCTVLVIGQVHVYICLFS